MTDPIRNRSHLLLGSATAALALALALPQRAEAQAINAEGTVVTGSAEITPGSGEDLIDIFSPTVVIDWNPFENAAGDALDFLPTGATARFQSSSLPDFAVLNRILPATNGNIAVIDGNVISRVFGQTGPTAGGFVAFYSPTGILIGNNASFDVGSLLLTTLEPDATSFADFAENGGFMQLAGATGSTARIQIDPGAQILASPENAFFAAVAADVEMRGTAFVNGSHAYVAGEVVNLQFSNGLFNIIVPVGTAASGTVMEVDGNVGGPSSTGLTGDNHMIYGVAVAQNDPISMIFRGNLGFEPAQSAGIVNGEIILSANYSVFGRNAGGGSIADGIGAVFNSTGSVSSARADLFLEDFTATSSLLAVGTHRTQAIASGAGSSVEGNLLLVGRESAELIASNGQDFTISGDVLVDARDYGVVSSSLGDLLLANAQGGDAFMEANTNGTVAVGGDALVTADAIGGTYFGPEVGGLFQAGSAFAGTARMGANAGSLTINGIAAISARGVGSSSFEHEFGAEARGGIAQVFATQGGSITLQQDLEVRADAVGATGATSDTSTASDAFGGEALFEIFESGSILVGGSAFVNASAAGGLSNDSADGSLADAGTAVVSVDGDGQITITGDLFLNADALGGTNQGGAGGTALGGAARLATSAGGSVIIENNFDATASAFGGEGTVGGDGFGGIAGAIAITGS
ncbi:MAG: hypothetical protein HLUCCX21_07235, partial [Porphyrobacter sp. HL-46]